jgi:hypothetical protein
MAENTIARLTMSVSPYGLAKFFKRELGINIEPQRMYQYAKSGKLVIVLNELGHKVVTPKSGNDFIEWFMDPNRGSKTETATEVEA